MPVCSYTLREGSLQGPALRFLSVGQPVYHHWSCLHHGHDQTENPYGMLVHSCSVNDGAGNRVAVIDKNGCGMDPYILGHPIYTDDLLEAYRLLFRAAQPSSSLTLTPFQRSPCIQVRGQNIDWISGNLTRLPSLWPCSELASLQCQIRLCFKSMDTCRGMTPPKCRPLRSRRALTLEEGREEEESWGSEDVWTPRLLVLDPNDFPPNRSQAALSDWLRETLQGEEERRGEVGLCVSERAALLGCVLLGILSVLCVLGLLLLFLRQTTPARVASLAQRPSPPLFLATGRTKC